MGSLAGGTGAKPPAPGRSPVRVFHAVLFVLGGGLAVVWSPWGLLLMGAGLVVGLLLLRAKASTLDMDQERRHLDQLRDDLTWLRDSAEHPDGSAHDRLRTLEMLRRYGRIGSADYEAQRAELVRGPRDAATGADGPDAQ